MADQETRPQALEYATPPADARRRRNRLVLILLAAAVASMLFVVLLGFTWSSNRMTAGGVIVVRTAPAPVPAAPAVPPAMPAPGFAPELEGGGDTDYDAARAAVTALLDDLLAGRRDDDAEVGPIARRVKGYRSWSITSQRKSANVPGSWTFSGILVAPGGRAEFGVVMVRQRGDEWAVGSFRGPDRK